MDARLLPAMRHLRAVLGRDRRTARTAAAALGMLLVLSACRAPSRAPTEPGATQTREAAEAFALWPEETPAEARAAAERLARGEDPWRSDPRETALAFASSVLGWETAVAGSPTDQAGGLTTVAIRREPGGPEVSVRLLRCVDGRWWCVYNAWGGLEHDPSLSVHGHRMELRFAMQDAASALVVVEYGDLRLQRAVERERAVRFDLEIAPREPGYFLLLLRDAQGRVFGVASSPLPAGDFAAG